MLFYCVSVATGYVRGGVAGRGYDEGTIDESRVAAERGLLLKLR